MAPDCHDEFDEEDKNTEKEAPAASLAHPLGTYHEENSNQTVDSESAIPLRTPQERYTEMMRLCEEYARAIQHDEQATEQFILLIKEKLEAIKAKNKSAVATKPRKEGRQWEKGYCELYSPRSKRRKYLR